VRWCNRPFGWTFVSRMIGIICFLIVVVMANILKYYISAPVYLSGVTFLNENFWLLILIAAVILVGDLFMALPFPLNLPAPVIKAIGSVFFIAFLLRCFQWVDSVASTSIYPVFWWLSFLIVPLTFLIVLACGYIEIIRQFIRPQRAVQTDGHGEIIYAGQPSEGVAEEEESPARSWDDVGSEFRMMLYDIIHRFREEVRRRP
jgi:hypothetical protein